jgi:hypothetical protein
MIARDAHRGKAKVKMQKAKVKMKKQRGLHRRSTKAALFSMKDDESQACFHPSFCLLHFYFCLTQGPA